ncbi:DALR anticodon-binding domain-containing protein [Streptomyces sp. ASQP_92]|uniref:ArgS-related anticodon-binding protein NrtL n=1 Tax=Streptomyces sp. ASQP_92 TaxID=2979116 RepID=UPI0021C13C96|nr:DALR anticodon-binding domain-containing protein [Streptomyces sp. ASQP_92]MCT9091377.1 DALR anticodon-binding domain-containing protein [Streptomyces sp. ASQP_92]
MTPAELSRTVAHVVRGAVGEGALGAVGDVVPEAVKVERPRPGGAGDYASGIALKLASAAGLPPRQVAEVLRQRIAGRPGIASVEISGPGFLNITLDRDAQYDLVRHILESTSGVGAAGAGRVTSGRAPYGHGDALRGETHEFVDGVDERGRVVVEVVVGLLRAQGAVARVVPGGSGRKLAVVPCPVPRLAELVGVDAARWAMLRAARHDRPRTDVEELLAQRESNSLFRVRYAYSRSRALTRNALELGFRSEAGPVPEGGALLGLLGDHPTVLEGAARHRAPDRLARHLEAVADELLRHQHAVLPRGDEKPSAAHRSRLALAEAAGTVLAGGLSLLGIDAPEFL